MLLKIAFTILLIAFQGAMLLGAFRSQKMAIFPHGAVIFIIYYQIVLLLQVLGVVDYRFMHIYSSMEFVYNFYIYQILLFFYSLIIYFGASYGVAAKAVQRFKLPQLNMSVVASAILIVYIWFFIYISMVNFSVIWYNNEYLLMESLEALNTRSSMGGFIIMTRPLVSIVISIIFFYMLFKGNTMAALLTMPVFVFVALFEVAAHSRMAFVIFALGMMIAILLKRSRPTIVSLGILSFVLLLSAISGRVSGHHGFATLPGIFSNVLSTSGEDVVQSLLNLAEGVYVTGEIFANEYTYPLQYKILSMSPLPSFLDGFDKILPYYEYRNHTFVPISSLHEAYNFGLQYLLFYIAMIVLAGRLTYRDFIKSGSLLSLAANGIVFLGFVLHFAYPVRNCMRFFWLAIAVILIRKALNYGKATRKAAGRGAPLPLDRRARFQAAQARMARPARR